MQAFCESDEFPVSDWIIELCTIMKHVEGIKTREAHVRFIENAGEMLAYYSIGMTPKQALAKFWGDVV